MFKPSFALRRIHTLPHQLSAWCHFRWCTISNQNIIGLNDGNGETRSEMTYRDKHLA